MAYKFFNTFYSYIFLYLFYSILWTCQNGQFIDDVIVIIIIIDICRDIKASKYDTLTQSRVIVGPASKTMGQH